MPADRKPRGLWLLTLFFLFSGCTETNPRLAFSPPPSIPFEELKQRVSHIRGLRFQRGVSLETKEIQISRSLLEKSFVEDPANGNPAEVVRVYERLGLLDEGTDLSKALEELRRFRREAVYDPLREKIFLQQGPSRRAATFPGFPWTLTGEAITQLQLVQALTHALQEENFHLEQRFKNRGTLDGGLALRALSKGDAVLVGLTHLMGEPKKEKLTDDVKTLQGLGDEIDREFRHLPGLLRRTETFQYLQGSQFVLWAHSLVGWQGVNNLYADPPLSTKQILHPEKYYAKREDPVRIVPWALIRELKGKKILDDTLGELLIQILLGRFVSEKEARESADGWKGDTLLAFLQGEGLVLAWVTAWEDREKARHFYRSYQRGLERRYGVALEKSRTSADTLLSASQAGPRLVLQIKDDLVFFLDGIPPPRSEEIAERLWKELEIGTEVIRPPFDVASRTR